MRLCCITYGFPYPLTSGRLRTFHLVRHLKATCEIKLVCVVEREADAETRERLTQIVDELEVVAVPGLHVGDRWTRSTASSGLRQMLSRSCKDFGAEAIVATYGIPSASLPFDVAPVAVDLCDSEWPKLLERAQMASFPESLRLRIRAFRARAYERAVARRASHMFFGASRDAEHVMGGIETPYSVIPNGIDPDHWRRSGGSMAENTVLYAGAFSYFPNIDAATLLATEIFPRIQEEVPDARLLLVGRDPPDTLRARHDPPQVTVTGFVPDIRRYYEAATVFVAPLRIAGGIQNKLLEAMALELPVVTTEKGIAGLGLPPGELVRTECDVTVANTPEEMAVAAAAVLRRRAVPTPVAANRALVQRHFSWQRAADRMRRVLEDLVVVRV